MEHRPDEARHGYGAASEEGAAPGEERAEAVETGTTMTTAVEEEAEQEEEEKGEGRTKSEEPATEATEEPAAEATEAVATEASEEPAAEATEAVAAEASEEPAAEATEEETAEEETAEAAATTATTNGAAPASGADRVELYTEADLESYRSRWDAILAGFVYDPRAAAGLADALIGELVDRVSQRREQLRDELAHPDDRGETEAMRQAIFRYQAIYRALVRE